MPNISTNVSWLQAVETTVPAANLVNNLASRDCAARGCASWDWASHRSTATSSQRRIGGVELTAVLVLAGVI
jgi:hypothetical protein